MLVMGVTDLPSSIAGGACALQPGCGFPLGLTEASAKGRAEEAYPVLVLGTQVNISVILLCHPSLWKNCSNLVLTGTCITLRAVSP